MTNFQDNIKILIASDIHAGYGEGKKIIDEDSFIGLEETLQHATEKDVDFVLLGGDLYHESVPSRYTEHKVIALLRKYCLNDREVEMQMISDPTEVFENSQFKLVNYEDPNINVGLPIFSIHGNHDDFSGKGLMALDILHDAGLLNLFGKFNSVDTIIVKPILLRKGDAKVALYGIGSQRDDRLQRAFHAGKVKFCFPEDVDEWFNILVVHQNRPPRSTTRSTGSFLPLSVLPSKIDLIIWGHEHKCEIEPQFFPKGKDDPNDGFFIIQPGSTVATSVSADETSAKHVAVLNIKGKTFKTEPIPLQRVRQIFVEDLDLAKIQPKPRIAKLKARTKDMEDEKLIHAKLKEMIEFAKRDKGFKQPDLPRMRLRVIYSGDWLKIPPASCRIVGHKYEGKVANPSEIISVKTIREETDEEKEKRKRISTGGRGGSDGTTVHDLLKESFNENDIESGLGILNLQKMQQYVNVVTKMEKTEAKKRKFQILEEDISEQVAVYKSKIAELPVRHETNNKSDVDFIRRSVEKVISNIKDHNRKSSTTEWSCTPAFADDIKRELDASIEDIKDVHLVEDVEDRENSYPLLDE